MTDNYYVIGGQYESCCYGATETLRAAKLLAAKNAEYWDNYQGWHRPKIYAAADVREIESRGRVTTHDGERIHVPADGALPVAVWDGKRWTAPERN